MTSRPDFLLGRIGREGGNEGTGEGERGKAGTPEGG